MGTGYQQWFWSIVLADNPVVVGKHLITIEGLGNVDHPHPLQERIAKLHGSQ